MKLVHVVKERIKPLLRSLARLDLREQHDGLAVRAVKRFAQDLVARYDRICENGTTYTAPDSTEV